jgi:F-box and WD-40 domain protein CDC4
MDGTVRVWNIQNGECLHTLTGHTSLVGLLGLSPSHLVSAAADSTLRIWDPDSGELRHTLAAHTGAITCFQHDEFKVLSGSDGNLKMWNIRDGSIVRDLLTGITGVWQVVFEGRWCVAASNRSDVTVLDVWDFGDESDDEWIGEPPNGLYDEDIFSDSEGDDSNDPGSSRPKDDEDDEQEQADVDAMDQDLVASETDSVVEIEFDPNGNGLGRTLADGDVDIAESISSGMDPEGVDASRWAPTAAVTTSTHTATRPWQFGRSGKEGSVPTTGSRRTNNLQLNVAGSSSVANGASGAAPMRQLPNNDETPTRPRIRPHHLSRRR